ncbi:hypothetical protein GJ496_008126 [Pomphorhynchus laevis]|nr:hypothetical protein GJ496_008126 [Pomphorhynchus laevis]
MRLIGFDPKTEMFTKSPITIRQSSVYTAFMSNLADVLDHNFLLGNIILKFSLQLMLYSVAPSSFVTTTLKGKYSLSGVSEDLRESWTRALLVIIYKYKQTTSEQIEVMQNVIKVAINTIAQYRHTCGDLNSFVLKQLNITIRKDPKQVTEVKSKLHQSVQDIYDTLNDTTSIQTQGDSQSRSSLANISRKRMWFLHKNQRSHETIGLSLIAPTFSAVNFRKEKDSYALSGSIHDIKANACGESLINVGNNGNPKGRKARSAERAKSQSRQCSWQYRQQSTHDSDEANSNCGFCHNCNEHYAIIDEHTVGSCILVCLFTVHNDPKLSAPLLMDMMCAVCSVPININQFAVDHNSFFIPSNCESIARQFMRCTSLQMSGNGIFYQILINPNGKHMILALISALNEFQQLCPITALKQTLKDVALQKPNSQDSWSLILENLSTFVNNVQPENNLNAWIVVLDNFETLFNTIISTARESTEDFSPIISIIKTLVRQPLFGSRRGLMECLTKTLSLVLSASNFDYNELLELCSLSNKLFAKERERFWIARAAVTTLFDHINCDKPCSDRNILLIIQFILNDIGGSINSILYTGIEPTILKPSESIQTCGAEFMRSYNFEILTFVSEVASFSHLKEFSKEYPEHNMNTSLTEDVIGCQIKAGLSQYLALEFTRGRESRLISRMLPWLYDSPSSIQGPEEFAACSNHLRLLNWLLIGSLTHSAISKNKQKIISQPVPIDARMDSSLHISSLCHSVILCQLWTMYCEQYIKSETVLVQLMEFWTRITPAILQLIASTKDLGEMMNLHFLSLLEALQESNSVVLAKPF